MGGSAVLRTFCPALSLLPWETAWQQTGTLVLQAGEPISTSPSLELHLLWMWSAYQFCRGLTFWVAKKKKKSRIPCGSEYWPRFILSSFSCLFFFLYIQSSYIFGCTLRLENSSSSPGNSNQWAGKKLFLKPRLLLSSGDVEIRIEVASCTSVSCGPHGGSTR